MFPDGLEEHVHHTLVLLVAARLSGDVSFECSRVGDIVDLVSGRDPETALAVRSLFRLG